jgi:hypothetical protein
MKRELRRLETRIKQRLGEADRKIKWHREDIAHALHSAEQQTTAAGIPTFLAAVGRPEELALCTKVPEEAQRERAVRAKKKKEDLERFERLFTSPTSDVGAPAHAAERTAR